MEGTTYRRQSLTSTFKKSKIIEKNGNISSTPKTLRFSIEDQNISSDVASCNDITLIEYEANEGGFSLMKDAVTRATLDTSDSSRSSQEAANMQKLGPYDPIPAPFNLQQSHIQTSPPPRWSLQSPSSPLFPSVNPYQLSGQVTENEEDRRSVEATSTLTDIRRDACIFKVYDDCRQDALVIQVSYNMIESTTLNSEHSRLFINLVLEKL